MAVQIVYSNHPGFPEKIHGGIETDAALSELARIYKINVAQLLQGDVSLELPTENQLATVNINSSELINMLRKHCGKTIYIHSDDDPQNPNHAFSNIILSFPIQ